MRAKKRWTDEDLCETFLLFKSRYFQPTLDEPITIAFKKMDALGRTFTYRELGGPIERFGIHISNHIRFSRRLWATTLLHEMVHLEQRNKYSCGVNGHRFNRRMKELARKGAFNGLW